jgi:hypothetical protein
MKFREGQLTIRPDVNDEDTNIIFVGMKKRVKYKIYK